MSLGVFVPAILLSCLNSLFQAFTQLVHSQHSGCNSGQLPRDTSYYQLVKPAVPSLSFSTGLRSAAKLAVSCWCLSDCLHVPVPLVSDSSTSLCHLFHVCPLSVSKDFKECLAYVRPSINASVNEILRPGLIGYKMSICVYYCVQVICRLEIINKTYAGDILHQELNNCNFLFCCSMCKLISFFKAVRIPDLWPQFPPGYLMASCWSWVLL